MAQAKRKRTPAGPRILKYEAIESRAIGIALRVRLRKMGFCESEIAAQLRGISADRLGPARSNGMTLADPTKARAALALIPGPVH